MNAPLSAQEKLYARIVRIEEELRRRGVKDIKLARSGEATLPHLMEDVAEALEAYLDGRFRPLPPLGDSQRARSLAEVSNTDGRHQASTLIDAGSSPAGRATQIDTFTENVRRLDNGRYSDRVVLSVVSAQKLLTEIEQLQNRAACTTGEIDRLANENAAMRARLADERKS